MIQRLLQGFLFVFLLWIHPTVRAVSVRIGVSAFQEAGSLTIIGARGNYDVVTDQPGIHGHLMPGQTLTIESSDGKLALITAGGREEGFMRIALYASGRSGYLRIRPSSRKNNSVPFSGTFEFLPSGDKVSLINTVELEEYVACVLESEIGGNVEPEMIKVQSILTRTYALSHLDRHDKEGYSLCDKVHCQVYAGRIRYNETIHRIVASTKGKVAVDSRNRLIVAAYHSNCGGETAASNQVWSDNLAYLQCVTDTFCASSQHAQWTKYISRSEWERYLKSKGITADSLYFSAPSAEKQNRTCCLLVNDSSLQLKQMRKELDLKSAFFTASLEGDSVILRGRGYGHGVGLCQEGASRMAALGYSAAQIISFYYRGVHIASYGDLRSSRTRSSTK